ncbi:zinc-ribbon domain-containing protein [Stieleria sp. TO1_6]|uniref:zinc-ribbon domain-containing protein n=1 Tax=Stieleria tagensis TaxID=2956795 RepID=UPI00209A77FF|nr:zinc-ribbon domain-containing protein [Stieleria tagensis]MCO8121675.1 zinc-ribbon domain-containing protein [Stieleria tagensis]
MSKKQLNRVSCPQCSRMVDDRAPACPFCGEKIYVVSPGGITPTKHPPLDDDPNDSDTPSNTEPLN